MSTPAANNRDEAREWEGGDPPCWAHLFEDEEVTAPEPDRTATPTAAAPATEPPAPAESTG